MTNPMERINSGMTTAITSANLPLMEIAIIKAPISIPGDRSSAIKPSRKTFWITRRDSRYFGPVSVDDVTSIAVLIYWPLSDFGLI